MNLHWCILRNVVCKHKHRVTLRLRNQRCSPAASHCRKSLLLLHRRRWRLSSQHRFRIVKFGYQHPDPPVQRREAISWPYKTSLTIHKLVSALWILARIPMIAGYVISYLGTKLHFWVQNYTSGYKTTFLSTKLHFLVENYISGYKTTFLGTKLHILVQNYKQTSEY
jgi:hypothetical protein